MQLPRELSDWSALLSLFPPDLAVAVGTLVRRLAVAIGPMGGAPLAGIAEPDGYAGLASRGSYEHLLISEWLLAEELPHEFERRAAMGEHLFLKRATLNPKGDSVSVVLFDCGPGQLGAPRLVHVALMILLSRRAEAAGSRFLWGVLQAPGRGLVEHAGKEAILALLDARTVHEPSAGLLDAWDETLRRLPENREFWIVGELLPFDVPPGAQLVTLREPDAPDADALLVDVIRGRRRQTLELDLPPEKLVVRLLRNPFRSDGVRAVQAGARLVAKGGMVFSRNGRKIVVKLEDGSLAVYTIPNSPTKSPGNPRLISRYRNHDYVGVYLMRKRAALVSTDGDGMTLHGFPGLTKPLTVPWDKGELLQLGACSTLRPCYYQQAPAPEKHLVYMLDNGENLAAAGWGKVFPVGTVGAVRDAVFAMECHGERIAWVSGGASHLYLQVRGVWDLPMQFVPSDLSGVRLTEFAGPGGVHFCWLPNDHKPGRGGLQSKFEVAFPLTRGDIWQIRQMGLKPNGEPVTVKEASVPLLPGSQVVGMVRTYGSFFARGAGDPLESVAIPALVVLDPTRTVLTVKSPLNERVIRDETGEIAHVVTDAGHDQIAWLTRAGELSVFSLSRGQQMVRVRFGKGDGT